MNEPQLSIVVPTFDSAPTLIPCLEALHGQRCDGVEIIVADDGSSDGTADLVQERFPAVRVLRLPHAGAGAARAAALREVRAPRLAFIDADCVPDPGWVGTVLAAGEEPAVRMGRVTMGGGALRPLGLLLCFGEFLGMQPCAKNNFALLNVTGPTQVFQTHPMPAEDGEDRLLSWRMANAGVPIHYCPDQVVVHAPIAGLWELLHRQRVYARRFVSIRRHEPTLPGGDLLRLLGPAAAPFLAAGRLVRDLQRLWRAREQLCPGLLCIAACAVGIAVLRCLDIPYMAAAALSRPRPH